jgi:cytochrome c oxidase assembly factor CtaG
MSQAESTATRTAPAGPPLAVFAAIAAALAAAALLAPAALPAGVAEITGRFTATAAGAVCLGAVLFVVLTARPDDRGIIDPAAFRAHRLAERVAPVWALVAAAMVAIQAAADAGVTPARLLGEGGLLPALGASEAARGWLAAAVCATVTAIALRWTLRWEWHVPVAIPAAVGVLAVPVTGNAGQGPDHDYATSAVIVFALALAVLTGLTVSATVAPPGEHLRRRVRVATVAAAAVALVYGTLLAALLAGADGLLNTGYGRLALLAGAALLAVLALGVAALRGERDSAAARTGAVVAALTAVAAVSAMGVQAAPRLLARVPSVFDVMLGYELPGPPPALRLATFWRFDTFLGVAALALAGAYVVAVVRLRRRGDTWSRGRLISWLTGCAGLVLATGSGLRSYGSAMFSVHMVDHMLLNMFVPVLLVLGAPVTLALRALPPAARGRPPGARELILRLVHSPITTVMTHPVTAFVLFVGSLYAVYFTPVFDTLVRYHWGHEFMSVHFLITGYLFFWVIIGIDPGPRRLPFIGRLGLLFAVMPFHAFFGIALMTMDSAIGANFYRSLSLPWVPDIVKDQNLGGAIAWGSSELPIVIVAIALITQWARQDRREAVRGDRHADAGYGDDMEAYNAMLRELARNRR